MFRGNICAGFYESRAKASLADELVLKLIRTFDESVGSISVTDRKQNKLYDIADIYQNKTSLKLLFQNKSPSVWRRQRLQAEQCGCVFVCVCSGCEVSG